MASRGGFHLAIIGAGGIAHAHAAAARASEGRVKIVAAVDPVEASRKKFAEALGYAVTFADVDALLAQAKSLELHGVVVCTPPGIRSEIVRKCLAAGVAVLSEKPLASSALEAQAILDMSLGHPSVVCATGFCHRFAPAVLEMKKQVEAGRIGRLVRFENTFACDLPGHETRWISDKRFAGGGAFIDMGTHGVDLFHFLVGESSVKGALYDYKWAGRGESAATVMLKHVGPAKKNIEPGVAGVIVNGWAEPSRFTLALHGTGGMLFYDYEKPTELVYKDLGGKALVSSVETHEVRFARQLEAFATAVREGKKAAEVGLATFGDGLLVARAVEVAGVMADATG